MKVLVVKDGTVPAVVAKVMLDDLSPELRERYDDSESDPRLEIVEVADSTHWLGISWEDGQGFEYVAFSERGKALAWIETEADGEPVSEDILNPMRRWYVTVRPGGDEGYRHVVWVGI